MRRREAAYLHLMRERLVLVGARPWESRAEAVSAWFGLKLIES